MRSLALNQLEQALNSGSFLVDCRPTNDFAVSHIPGSISASIISTALIA